jgi:hypothetical protein
VFTELDIDDERDDTRPVSLVVPEISSNKRLNDGSCAERISMCVKIRFWMKTNKIDFKKEFLLTANFCVSGFGVFCDKLQRLAANFKHLVWFKSPCEIKRLKKSSASDDCRLGF